MAADGWTAIKTDPASETRATKLANELAVPGLTITQAKVLARALVVGLEEIENDHARFHQPARRRKRKQPSV